MAIVQTTLPDPDRLYNLLPEMYRTADAQQGYPLRALLRLIGVQADTLRADIQQLWDNFFIETCEQWAIPYIGDLVANRTLYDIEAAQDSTTAETIFTDLTGPTLRPISAIRTRADVAKTIYYRRRKGTTDMLQQLAQDVTGWSSHVVEFFEILTWTQNLNHIRLDSGGCADLRSISACDRIAGPFDPASHTVDVRTIAQTEGWYNVPNLGFFLWRLESFPLTFVRARAMGGTGWRFNFSPLGNSAPLFATGSRLATQPGMSAELFVEEPIPPSAFFDDLTTWTALPAPRPPHSLYYGDAANFTDWSLTVYEQATANGPKVAVDLPDIQCANLDKWTTLKQPADTSVRIDVKRGRILLGSKRPASAAVYVSFNYGFSAHMGGGPYPDRVRWATPTQADVTVIAVNETTNLDQAIQQWAAMSPAQNTLIRISDNDTHTLSQPLTLDAKRWLTIEASSAEPGFRPHIRPKSGLINVTGNTHGNRLTLNGLLIEGGIQIDQDIEELRLIHSTLVPGLSVDEENKVTPRKSLTVAAASAGKPVNTTLQVKIAFCITGPLQLPDTIDALYLLDSIVDGSSDPKQIALANKAATNGPRATIERTTILGKSFLRKLDLGSDTIFTDIVTVQDRVEGCLRFSFVPPGSSTPQPYRCQPAQEIGTEIDSRRKAAQASGQTLPPGWDSDLTASIERWLLPGFETIEYGRPDYCQLRLTTPEQIRTGASDGAEMGAFNQLKQAQREGNLRLRIAEYVPFGRAAGIIYVT